MRSTAPANTFPGLMGTLFSFVDKLISSLATSIVGVMCAMIGFKETLPGVDTPYSPQLKFIGLFCFFGLILFGLICNLSRHEVLSSDKRRWKKFRKDNSRN